jgi:hypothetical protein
MDRHARQRMLAAVGDEGQSRISAASYLVASDAAGHVARDYLERAGAERIEAQTAPPAPFAHASSFRHPSARQFAEGAWRALGQLRAALEKAP